MYLLALHFAFSQFTGGMDEVKPSGFLERAFTVIYFPIAWMTANAFVAGLTSDMTQLHMLASSREKKVNTLQQYLHQNKISYGLRVRVQRNAVHALNEQQRLMPESEVELLGQISHLLVVELHFEIYSPVLEHHPFFLQYVAECPQVARRICHSAMETLISATGDVIFSAGEMPSSPMMYIVCGGSLEYLPVDGSGFAAESTTCIAGNWLAEGVLWTTWMHLGVLRAVTDGRLCTLDAKTMQDIVGQVDHADLFEPRLYAAKFVGELNKRVSDGTRISDLQFEDDIETHIVAQCRTRVHVKLDGRKPRASAFMEAPRKSDRERRPRRFSEG